MQFILAISIKLQGPYTIASRNALLLNSVKAFPGKLNLFQLQQSSENMLQFKSMFIIVAKTKIDFLSDLTKYRRLKSVTL